MAIITSAPRGTQDVLPSQSSKWQFIENTAREIAGNYGFREIRFPTFEHTELFCRSVGDTTDVVQKEMYTFLDKGERSITLRPEGTAGAVRAVLQNGLLNEALPLKVAYLISCFRYEKPQAGRLREFHQFGAEMFGSSAPAADAEMISMAKSILESIGMTDLSLEINSIGCPKCRPNFTKALREYFEGYKDQLCPTCLERLEKNPMRILDCKSPICKKIAENAPVSTDYLCEECSAHFEGVKSRLNAMKIPYKVNTKIVRGLDYYTKTVFEFISDVIGSQSTVCGGGRYDGLISQMGGQPTPALGFAMGLERLLLALENKNAEFPAEKPCDIYIGSRGEEASVKALELTTLLRDEGFSAECDLMGRSVKAQMKYADKIGALHSMIIGESELESGIGRLKNMKTGEQIDVPLNEGLTELLYNTSVSDAIGELTDSLGSDFDASALLQGLKSDNK